MSERRVQPRTRRAKGAQSGTHADRLRLLGQLGALFSVHFKSVDLHLNTAIIDIWAEHEHRTGTFAALAMIVAKPGISQNEVARIMHLDKSGVNGIVNLLEANGWAERQRSAQDRRRNDLFASPAGEAKLATTISQIETAEAGMLAGLTAAEREQLTQLLDKLNESLIAAEHRT